MGVFLTILGCAALLVVVLGVIGLIVYSVAVLWTEYKYRDIPCPKGKSFFLGNMPHFLQMKEKLNLQSAQLIFMWTKTYGPVLWLRILWTPFVMAGAPEIAKEILLNSRHTKSQRVYRGFQYLYGDRFMGHGLVSEIVHEKWFHRRAIINPAFRRKYLIGMIDHFNEGAEALSRVLATKADGRTQVEMLKEFNNVTLDVIAKTAFSIDAEATGKPGCPFPSAISTALHGMQVFFDQPFIDMNPRAWARKLRQDVREGIGLVRKTGFEVVKERIHARKQGDYVPNDMLNVILDNAGDLEGDADFGMENLLDEFVTLFVAGQDTTSNLLAFTLLQLGRNPDVAKRLQAEVDDVLGQKSLIQYEDVVKLEYMTKVFKETLRLYPPVVGTTRQTAHPIKYRDFTIPAGALVSVLSAVMGRMDEYFDDPLLFNPDRFDYKEDENRPRHLYAYFPFSMGQRSCIGQQFALIEARVILGKLLQNFEFHLNQSQRTSILDELTSKPLDKCKNYITMRS